MDIQNANDIKVIRGTTNVIRVSLKNALGTEYILSAGEKLIFGVKDNPDSETYAIKKVIASSAYDSTNHCYPVTIDVNDTKDLSYSAFGNSYMYDIGLQDTSNNYYMVVAHAAFIIDFNITSREVV